ncbi:uncharacterized protein PpBr36_09679, partial [Pyricularia pennisetigena]|uniref:uncharacterized protein n=1 Tax=Pyricularia pennisetigena TaxID=1578925 RepID=UPI0011520C22
PFFSSGTASYSVGLVPQFATTNRPKTTRNSILGQLSTLGMDESPRGGDAASQTLQPLALPPVLQQQSYSISPSQICTDTYDEEGELEYDGPGIPDALRAILIVPKNPMEPVMTMAKSIADSWVAERALKDKIEREAYLTSEDEVIDSYDFNTDEGSDVESDSVQTLPSPITVQAASLSPSQTLNAQPFFASTASASISTEGTATSFPTGSNAEFTAWDTPTTIPGSSYGIVASSPSQSRNTAPLDTSQMVGLSVAAWIQPMDLPEPTTLDSPLHNSMQQPFRQFPYTGPFNQNTSSATDHYAKENSMGEACTWQPEDLSDQNSVANRPIADVRYTNLVDHRAAVDFIPEPPFHGQISSSAMTYQSGVMGSFQQPDEQTWPQSQQDQAQEQQQFVFPTETPFIPPNYEMNEETRCTWIFSSPSSSDSGQDKLPGRRTYAGPALYGPGLEDAAYTQMQLEIEQYRPGLDHQYQQQYP